jgi:hypothetical protein
MTTTGPHDQIDRRRLLRTTGLVGGAAFAAPVITLATAVPAYAMSAGGDPTPTPGTRVSLRSATDPNSYVIHDGTSTSMRTLSTGDPVTDLRRATFTVTAGLNGRSTISFQSEDSPTSYLRHAGFVLLCEAGNTDLYRSDASFFLRAGLSGTGTSSFEASNLTQEGAEQFPGHYLRRIGSGLYLSARDSGPGPYNGPAGFDEQVSFIVAPPLAPELAG